MTKHKAFLYIIMGLLITSPMHAQPGRAPQDITVIADAELLIPLQRIVQDYARRHQCSVTILPLHDVHAVIPLEEGLTADVIITAHVPTQEAIWQRGLVDVNARREVVYADDQHYRADVIAGEQMDDARRFVQYVTSIAATPHFKAQKFNAP